MTSKPGVHLRLYMYIAVDAAAQLVSPGR